jgi:hypothetical protein
MSDTPFPINRMLLKSLQAASSATHEAYPLGVFGGYDWALHGVVHAGASVPAGSSAVVGWGQCFSVTPGVAAGVQLRSIQTWVRSRSGLWTMSQIDGIEGGLFLAAYTGNSSQAIYRDINGVLSGDPRDGNALHFWGSPRGAVASDCTGVATLFEAKADTAGSVLVGAGADYWSTNISPYPSNTSVGVGQLCFATTSWQCYGFAVAP